MTTRRVSVLVGMLCLIASTAVAAAPPGVKLIDGKCSGMEWCWQDLCGFAGFSGTYNGKVSGEHTTGWFSALVTHQTPLPTAPGERVNINEGGFWLIWTQLGYFEGTVTGGTLAATKNVNRFHVTVNLQMTNGLLAKFDGVLDHSGLTKQPPEPPTIIGDVVTCEYGC